MAKDNLIGGALWEEYSDIVNKRMENPIHKGEISEEEAKAKGLKLIVADYGAEACGDAVRLYWAVDPETNIIKDAKFKSFGCGTAIASSDTMIDLCIGKTVDEVVKITNLDVEKAMRDDPDTPAIPPQKMHCSVLAYDVIKKAASIYKGVDIKSFQIDPVVCECAQVTLSTIKEVIRINDLHTVEEITNYTKAGAFCKSCIKPGGHEKRDYYLVDILKEVREEMDQEKREEAAQGEPNDFKAMTIVQKMKIIEKLLDDEIRPMLAADGGSLELVDIKEDGDDTVLYIRYLGACVGCASASTGTLYAIQDFLDRKLDKNISVLPV